MAVNKIRCQMGVKIFLVLNVYKMILGVEWV